MGVVSTCGQEVTRVKIGFMVFQNEVSWGDISAWGLDDRTVALVQAQLQGRYVVGKAELGTAQLGPRPGLATIDALRRAIRPEPRFDAYLLVVPASRGEGMSGMQGMGLVSRGPSDGEYGMMAQVECRAVLYDRTDDKPLGFVPIVRPMNLPRELRFDRWSDYGEPQRERVRAVLSEMFDGGLAGALAWMKLKPK